jgi:hypothetical protein
MLAEPEHIESHLIGEDDLLHEVAQALGRADAPRRGGIGAHVTEGVESDFHQNGPSAKSSVAPSSR